MPTCHRGRDQCLVEARLHACSQSLFEDDIRVGTPATCVTERHGQQTGPACKRSPGILVGCVKRGTQAAHLVLKHAGVRCVWNGQVSRLERPIGTVTVGRKSILDLAAQTRIRLAVKQSVLTILLEQK